MELLGRARGLSPKLELILTGNDRRQALAACVRHPYESKVPVRSTDELWAEDNSGCTCRSALHM
jgi:hypothetical protein